MLNLLVPLAAKEPPIFGLLHWWQLGALVVLIGLIIFWVQYRKRQM